MPDNNDDQGDQADDNQEDQPTRPQDEAGFAEVVGNVVDAKMTAFMETHITPTLTTFATQIREDMAEQLDPQRLIAKLSQVANQNQVNNALGAGAMDMAVQELETAGGQELEHNHEAEGSHPNLRGDLGQVAAIAEFVLEKFMSLRQFNLGMSNPFDTVSKIAQQYPHMAPYLGAMLSPHPDTAQLANASTMNGFNQGFKAGQIAANIKVDAPLGPSGNPIDSNAGTQPTESAESAPMNGSVRPNPLPMIAEPATAGKRFESFMK